MAHVNVQAYEIAGNLATAYANAIGIQVNNYFAFFLLKCLKYSY